MEEPPTARQSVLARVRSMAGELKGRMALALLLGGLALGSAVGLMAVSGWLISRASEQPPILYLMMGFTATRAFGIGLAVFRYAERLVSHDAVLRMLADLRVSVFRRLERIAPAGLRRTRRGDLLARLVQDVDALQDYWLRWLLPAGTALLVGVASAGFTAWLLPEAGAVLAVGLLVAGIAGGRRRPRPPGRAPALPRARHPGDRRGRSAARLRRGHRGRCAPGRIERARDADRTLTSIASRQAAATALGAGLSALVCGLTVAAAALVGVQAVRDGRLDGVVLAVIVLTALAAFEAVTGLPLAVQYRQRVKRSAERVFEVLDAPVPVHEPRTPAVPGGPVPAGAGRALARHAGQERFALDGFALTLEAGRRVAVVGASGSGKTTLAQVLLKFLDVEHGVYRIGGVPAGELDGDAVRRLVGLCAQDAHLFDSSVRENLRLAKVGADDEELREALRRARLLDWVDGLPAGLDTLVGEHGSRLSGGQRQRLALARALLADFPVLVLDEPAEHLDLATADALTDDLLRATEGRTTVLITHRLHGLDAVDEVVVLAEGRTVQRPVRRARGGGRPAAPDAGAGAGDRSAGRHHHPADFSRQIRTDEAQAHDRRRCPTPRTLWKPPRSRRKVPRTPWSCYPGHPQPPGLSTELTARVPQLLEAMRSVGTGLELHSTLDRICETAAELADARYAAISVLSTTRAKACPTSSPSASTRTRPAGSATAPTATRACSAR
ncbi:Vitamin B12 import ATP-binding protein BtuD [Streptomyces tanashiensis]